MDIFHVSIVFAMKQMPQQPIGSIHVTEEGKNVLRHFYGGITPVHLWSVFSIVKSLQCHLSRQRRALSPKKRLSDGEVPINTITTIITMGRSDLVTAHAPHWLEIDCDSSSRSRAYPSRDRQFANHK